MPQQQGPANYDGDPSWPRVGTAEEAKRHETKRTIQRPMAAIDYDRRQDERWAKLAPDLVVALDKLFGKESKLEAPPTHVIQNVDDDIDELDHYYHGFW